MTRLGGIAGVAAVWLLGVACGGRSESSEPAPDADAGASTGVAGTGVAGTGVAGTGGTASVEERCPAMDAHSSGDDCTDVTGYAYDGRICAPVVCGCVGADCERLFPSIAACDEAYAGCYAWRGLSLECAKHADCALVTRRCCATCAEVGPDELIAVKSGNPRETGVCWGDPDASCGTCQDFSFATLHPACFEGICRVLDLTAHSSCMTEADCRITTKDCCECGGDFSYAGRIAVNTSFRAPDYCSADTSCDECAPSHEAPARCDTDLHLCAEGHYGLK